MLLSRTTSGLGADDKVQLLIIAIVFPILATTAVILRFIARRMKHARLVASDYWIIVALLGAYGNSIAEIVGYAIGVVGPHTSSLHQSQTKQAIQILLTAELSWSIAIGATKTSLLLFYLQLFSVTSRRIRIAAYTLLLVTALYTISTILYFAIHCRSEEASVCGNQQAGWIAISVFNIVTDILILSLPVPFVWKLQLPQAKKLALTGVFGVGFLVCIISILRIFTLATIDARDFTFTAVNADLYSVLEPTLGVTSACLPLIGPIFDRLVPARFLNLHSHQLKRSASKSRKSIPIPKKSSKLSSPTTHYKESDIERLNDPIVFPSEPLAITGSAEKLSTCERPPYPYQDHQINLSAPRYTAEIRGHTPIPLEDLESGMMEGQGIRVEQEWTVTSTREG